MMKIKLIPFSVFVRLIHTTNAQRNDKLKSLKVGYITKTLNLNSEEAQFFWPIYNKYLNNTTSLRHHDFHILMKQIKQKQGIKNLSEKEAQELLDKFIAIENKIQYEKTAMYENLKGVISSKKILKLHRAENDFNRKILQSLRKERAKQNIKN